MKKLFTLFICISMAWAAHAQNDSTQLAAKTLDALKSGKLADIQNLIAPVSVYREMYPEAKDLTDEQLKQKTSGNEKLKADFDALLKKISDKKLNLEKLQYDSLDAENPWGKDIGPWAITVYYSLNGKKSSLSIAALRHKGQWYFMEFLITTKAFEGL